MRNAVMKIQYTLPGYQPEITPLSETEEEGAISFERLMRTSQPLDSNTWEHALSLDRVPPGPTQFGPPPRPRSLEFRDVPAERLRWRQLLTQSSTRREASGVSAESNRVARMMAVLHQSQQAADDVWLRAFDAIGGK
jgi:hypothetical protein